jgi:hypothetical protein
VRFRAKNLREIFKVDRLLLKTMGDGAPKARISGGKPRYFGNALRTTRST